MLKWLIHLYLNWLRIKRKHEVKTENESGNIKTDPAAKSLQSCPTLCDPINGSPPGSPVPGILQASKYNAAAAAKSLQSCPTLCDPINGSPPGSPVPGIPQASKYNASLYLIEVQHLDQGS